MSIIKPIARQVAKFVPLGLLKPLARPAVVYFHGVEHAGSDTELEQIHHQTDVFEQIIRTLNCSYVFLPMQSLGDVLKQPDRYRNCLFLTFDDGYANNLFVADVLEGLCIPWTLFVSTDHVEKAEPDPIFLARLFFMHALPGTYALPYFSFHVILASLRQRKRMMDRGIAELKSLDAVRAEECLVVMKERLGHEKLVELVAETPSKRFLSWDQVRYLRNRGAEIGSHASIHWSMHEAQPKTYLREQAVLSKSQIEAEVGPCNYFAYPFGRRSDCSNSAWHAVRDAGYSHAFTAIPGTLDASRNPWLLPRYGIGMRDTSADTIIPMLRANNWRFRRWQVATSF
jgi:peptidoglycan/xylan/chitin deacetylase (PgdA/CDA1 family)